MPRPVCTALIEGVHSKTYAYLSLPKTIALTGSATNGPILEWEWSVLPTWSPNSGGYPEGSTVATGTNGSFTDGKSSTQNPTGVVLDLAGGYCFSLRARNADGWSAPSYLGDGTGCQAIVYILTADKKRIPPENMFRYPNDLNQNLIGAVNKAVGPTLHVYVDADSGDDLNDGSGSGTAKKSLLGLDSILPDEIHTNCVVHLKGTFDFSDADNYFVRSIRLGGSGYNTLLIAGENAYTIVADDSGDPWTADIYSSSSIGVTGVGWTPDAYAGYIVQIVSGTYAGHHRTIHSHTSTTITPTVNWPGDVGAAQFRIVRPATTFNDPDSYSGAFWLNVSGQGSLVIQNLSLTGTWPWFELDSILAGSISLHCVVHAAAAPAALVLLNSAVTALVFNEGRYNDTTLDWEGSPVKCGLSQTQSSADITISDGTLSFVYGLVAQRLVLNRVVGIDGGAFAPQWGGFSRGSRVFSLAASDCVGGSLMHNSGAGYATSKLGGHSSLPALTLTHCRSRLSGAVDVSNSPSHGVTVVHGFLHLDGAVAGSGNTGAGVYAHSGSVVHIKNGAAPTLTGTVGDLSTDGTTQKSTWAAIDGGTPVSDTAEMTMAKEVA